MLYLIAACGRGRWKRGRGGGVGGWGEGEATGLDRLFHMAACFSLALKPSRILVSSPRGERENGGRGGRWESVCERERGGGR